MDVSTIFLSDEAQQAFDKFKSADRAILSAQEYRLLAGKQLVQKTVDGASVWYHGVPDRGECLLTEFGKELRALQNQRQRARRKESRRYWITTGIAVAALIKSFMPEILAGLAWLWSKLGL